jgi:hypothetical protein
MIDDWTTPTDEHDFSRREHVTASPPPNPATRGPGDEIDPVFGVTSGELRIVDAFFYELALEAAEDPSPPTAEEQLAIDNLRSRFERLKAMTPEEQDAERARLRRAGW